MRRRGRDHVDEELRRLGADLDRWRVPEPPPELVERALLLARAELARPTPLRPASFAVGFTRELVQVLGLTLAPLCLVLVWNAIVIRVGQPLLATWLPEPVAFFLVGAYVVGALGWLGFVYASLPFVAHRRALMRQQEAT